MDNLRTNAAPAGQFATKTHPNTPFTVLPSKLIQVTTTPTLLRVRELAGEPALVHGFSTLVRAPGGLGDRGHRAAGLVHAGWRGTEADVAAEAVRSMAREFDSNPAHMKAAIGPGICGRCYEVGEEVASRFDQRFVRDTTPGKFLLDLAAANLAQLEEQGVREVFALNLCTKETGFLPSHRRTPDGTRFRAIVAIR